MKPQVLIPRSLFLFFFLAFAQLSFAQNLVGCPNCSCSNVCCGCKSGPCCNPNTPECTCTTFTCTCSCGLAAASLPEVHVENVLAFSTYLRGPEFNSPASADLAQRLDLVLQANTSNDVNLYLSSSHDAEIISRYLTTNEKSKANAWIQSKGGTTQIH